MKKTLISVLVFLSIFLFGATAMAQDALNGLDIRAGLSAAVLDSASHNKDQKTESTNNHDMAGLSGNIAVGWRFMNILDGHLGVFLDEDIAGLWKTEKDADKSYKSGFLGGTFIVVRGFYDLDNITLDVGFGLGVMYSNKQKVDEENGKTTPAAIRRDSEDDKDGSNAAFGLKLSLSGTYAINDMFGVGVHCDFDFSFKSFDDVPELKDTVEKNYLIMPGIHARMKF